MTNLTELLSFREGKTYEEAIKTICIEIDEADQSVRYRCYALLRVLTARMIEYRRMSGLMD